MANPQARLHRRLANHLDRREALIFWLLTASLLMPVWAPVIFTTIDGPAHLAVAALWSKIGDPRWPELAEFLKVEVRPVPNLTVYLLLKGLLAICSDITAEKLVASLYILSFAGAVRYLARVVGGGARAFSFLALPLVNNLAFEYGFYNFLLGLPLFILGLGFWLTRRDRPGAFSLAGYLAIFLAAYFTHLAALAMLTVSLAAIELQALLAAWRGSEKGYIAYLRADWRAWLRRWAPLLLGFLPAGLLTLYFLFYGRLEFTQAEANYTSTAAGGTLLRLGQLGAGAFFGTLERFTLEFSGGLVIVGLITLGFVLRRIDRTSKGGNPFSLALAICFALYLFLPAELITHWVAGRLMLYLAVLFVFWLFGFAPRLPADSRAGFSCLLALLVALYLAASLPLRLAQNQRHSDIVAEILSAAPALSAGRTLFTLRVRAPNSADALLPLFDVVLQAQSYLAARLPMIGLKNIQFNSGITPVHYRDAVNPYRYLANDQATIHWLPAVDLERYHRLTGRYVDFVLLWGREKFFQADGPAAGLKARLEQNYKMVFQSQPPGLVRVYRRKQLAGDN